MAAGLAEIHRDRSRDCVEKGEDEQFWWEAWDWESMVDEVGSAREAFEPRGSRELRRQEDGQEEGGNKVLRRQEDGQEEGGNKVLKRQEDGQDEGGNKVLRRQDDEHDEGDKRQTERQGEVVRRQSEDDMQQDGDGRGRGAEVRKSEGDETG